MLRDLRSLEIEGLSGDWPAELDERNTTEAAALAPPILDGTRRLDTLMKTQALTIRDDRRFRRRLVLALISAFVVGGGAALLLRPSFLLDNRAIASSASGIPKKATAAEQYLYAREADPAIAEAAWQSVVDWDDYEYAPCANQQLARYYLQHDRLDDALKIFEDFADLDEVETEYRAFGFAGESVVYFIKARHDNDPAKHAKLLERANNCEEDLAKLAGGLTPEKLDKVIKDRQMVQAIGNVLVLQKNRKTESDLWNKWLESHFHDEPATPTAQ